MRNADKPDPKDYAFILDVIKKKINKNPGNSIPCLDNRFAEEFVSNLDEQQWKDFYNFFREYKGDLSRNYKRLKTIATDFSDIEYSIEAEHHMVGFVNLIPYAAELRCKFEDIDYLLDDQYCLASSCNCHDVGLSLIEIKKSKAKITSVICYDYRKDKWTYIDKHNTPIFSVEEVILKLKSIYPDFCRTFRNRHETLRSIYSAYRKKSYASNGPKTQNSLKIGRNDPCPCGSGKKYKKCCG